MRLSTLLLPVCLLSLQSCSLQERLDSVSSDINQKYADVKTWEQLPIRTISWNQAVAMMKRNNIAYIQVQNTIEKAERDEMGVYTDLIPGVSLYSYFTRSLGDLTKQVNSNDFANSVNITFYLPSLSQIPYRVYATKASTYAAHMALKGKERELISSLYSLQRKQQLSKQQAELDKQSPDTKPDYLPRKKDDLAAQWMEQATLLGDFSARWQILPSSVPQFRWSDYRPRTGKLDELVVCKFAMELEQARMQQYSVALSYLPSINLNLYSPSLFSSTGGTYSGTFLDKDDTKLNMSGYYSLDTKLHTWYSYRNSKENYTLRQRETTAKLIDLKQKLLTLRTSLDEYYAWRGFMNKRIEHLRTAPASNAAEFLENESTLRSMQQELIRQETAVIESEAALILQYGLL
ncbi:MAG: hypothetical protein IKW48_02275 [Akkermansia sp.]|nr:hypothetical protein [Akkermansia sp.]